MTIRRELVRYSSTFKRLLMVFAIANFYKNCCLNLRTAFGQSSDCLLLGFILWPSSYLSNRHQAVRVGTNHNWFLPITSGVCQGSLLGPFMFIFYTNDLFHMNLDFILTRLNTQIKSQLLFLLLMILNMCCAVLIM